MDAEKSSLPHLSTSHSFPLKNDTETNELDKFRQWQEERKLSAVQESSRWMKHIQSNPSIPLRVASVRVEGTKYTRQSFLGWIINPLVELSTLSDGMGTLDSIVLTARRINHVLHETDIFQSIETKLEQSRDTLAGKGDVDVVFKVRERGRVFLNTSTEVGNGDGNASVTARVRNVLGGAEMLEANMSFGLKIRRSYRAVLSAPLSSDLNTRGEITVFGMDRDNSTFASSSEAIRGFKAVVRSGNVLRGLHEVGYEAVARHIGNFTPTVSMSMRESAGQSTKSSVSHSWVLDTRDDRLVGTRGYFLKLFQEVAGFGGDASFYKAEAEGKLSRSPFPGVTLSFAARSGFLWALSSPSIFSDRFHLGGPVSVRSFRQNSMGPRDGADSLGGDLYWAAGVSSIVDIPRKSHWPVKLHAFVNAGRLDTLKKSRKFTDNVMDCISKASISAGVGLLYRFDPIRVEVNFAVPLVASKSDGSRRGIQLGMGLEFL